LAGYIRAVTGEKPKAEAKTQQMLEQKKIGYVPPYNLALVFAGLRATETALHWLEQALADRDVLHDVSPRSQVGRAAIE